MESQLNYNSEDLEKKLTEITKEAEYYKHIARLSGEKRLRETEELSKVTLLLKEKIIRIEEQKKELEQLYIKLEKKSITDDLTQLLNRRGLFMHANNLFNDFERKNFNSDNKNEITNKFVCAMIDLDHFKKVNDTYGHQAGDKILIDIAEIFQNNGNLRANDIVARYGGEEFAMFLSSCDEEKAHAPLNKIHQNIRNKVFNCEGEIIKNITVSIGISEVFKDDSSVDDVIKRADDALYFAKKSGRDRIVLFSEISQNNIV